jgi:asparagine synthase (glutamine-hydrolysing)
MAAALATLRSPSLQSAHPWRPAYESLMDSLDDEQLEGRDPLNRSLYLSCKSSLPNLILATLADRVEMAHGVEGRLPFLDHKVVEFVARLPVELKIKVLLRSGIEKYILHEAARPLVPDAIYRRRKHVFSAPPTISAVADPMSELIADTLHGADARQLDLYDHRKVLALYERSKDGHDRQVSRALQHVAGMAILQRQFGLTL